MRIAVFSKAPVPGRVKTRLAAHLGDEGAARLAASLTSRALATAVGACVGPVELWCSPDSAHSFFQECAARFGVTLREQRGADLGERMRTAIEAALAEGSPVLLIGSDCPALTPAHLRDAAEVLKSYDAVLIPAEDGGYVLIGLRKPQPVLFADLDWGTPTVMAETRFLLSAHNLTWRELPPLWDVDTAEDLERLKQAGLPDLP